MNPRAGLDRMRDRIQYDYVKANKDEIQRGYEAAKRDRLNASWKSPNQSPDLEMDSDADITRGRARSLVRDNAYAKGVIRAAVRNVVGTGIRPNAQMLDDSGEINEPLNEYIEEQWEEWQAKADISGRMSFYQMQQLIVSERWEAGEILVHFVDKKSARLADPSRRLPFALELIDADRIASDERYPKHHARSGNEVRRGVEIDKTGKAVAYWLYPYHPNDLNTVSMRPKRHDASEFLHLYRPLRVGQTRGISEFAPIVRWVKNLDRYMDNELTSSTIASCFSVAIKSMQAGADGGLGGGSGAETTDSNSNQFEFIEPGVVARLFPGEDIEVIDPSRRQSDAVAWLTLMQRALGVGTGLSYERLTRDYSQTNYSSNRASDLEDRREFRIEQEWLIEKFCIPVWERFLTAAAIERVPGMPSASSLILNRQESTRHTWQAPGWEWVDPAKEVNAIKEAIQMNLSSLATETRKRDGGDWRKTVRQRGVEKQLIQDTQGKFGDVEKETATQTPSTEGGDDAEL